MSTANLRRTALSLAVASACIALHAAPALAQEVAAATAPADAPAETMQSVIVTGTRTSGLRAIDSASPVQVLDSTSLEKTGQPDLIQAMAQNLPSFTAQAFGGDAANLTLSARLRGLSPNDTLVLVNGKRRHTTANLAVLGGPYQGGAAADLNFIPVAAIDHIEVLQDGAAAQYGTDAIAGVVNIILKKDTGSSTLTGTGGQYMDGGGRTGDVSFNTGFAPTDSSFINMSLEQKSHGNSNRGGPDPRLTSAANLAAIPTLTSTPGYPNNNMISGDASYHLTIASMNAGIDLTKEWSLYSVATYGKKKAEAFENYRLPNRIPGLYPLGFSPKEAIDEDDFQLTLGANGKLGDWDLGLSTTFGQDKVDIGVLHSANASLYADTGSTPTDFHAGQFKASQWTSNVDLSHAYDIGWATPLNIAFGYEHREDTYEIGAGDAASRYKEGSQSYPGFSLTDAGHHSRNNNAIYADFAASPIKELKLDAAARFEDFSDFGSAKVGKLTGRYDFSPQVAIRSTISNGFRAPTMAEQYYSATNVSPTSAFVQLAPNSAGAAVVGVNGLKPEKSTNYSLGLVLHPAGDVALTLDAYQITIRDRIVGSGAIYGSGGSTNSPAVTAAILANGNVLDPTVSQTGINIFSNAVDTRTRGLEAVLTTNSDFKENGRVAWSAAASYNKTEVTKINQAPTQLQPQTLLDQAAISDLETASPKFRLNLGALWKLGIWSVNLRESIYGPSSEFGTEDGGQYFETKIKTLATTDLEVSARVTKAFTLSVGANNLFNKYPNMNAAGLLAAQRAANDSAAVQQYPSFSPIGINGGYYYVRGSYTF